MPVEGQLCRYHGGLSPAVQARQEVETLLRGRQARPVLPTVDPKRALGELLGMSQLVLDRLQSLVEQDGKVSDEAIERLRPWMDLHARMAKTVIEMGATPALIDEEQSQAIGLWLTWVVEQSLADVGVDPTDAGVRAAIHHCLDQVQPGDPLPPLDLSKVPPR